MCVAALPEIIHRFAQKKKKYYQNLKGLLCKSMKTSLKKKACVKIFLFFFVENFMTIVAICRPFSQAYTRGLVSRPGSSSKKIHESTIIFLFLLKNINKNKKKNTCTQTQQNRNVGA